MEAGTVEMEDMRMLEWLSLFSEAVLWVKWLRSGLGTISLLLELRINHQLPQLEIRHVDTYLLAKDVVEKEGECLLFVDLHVNQAWVRASQIYNNLE